MGEESLANAGRTVGRYVLFDEIASGGMATIHFGRLVGPVGFSRTVAIKRLHAQYAKDAEFVAMFLDEARLAARIRHPNVVPTLDVVQADGELLLVMEYVQGEALSKLIRWSTSSGTRAPLTIVSAILSGMLHGLHAAHEAKGERGEALNIVHRDVSPQNILVGVDGVPRLLDFGVAKATQRVQSTRDGQVKGKLSYMAPEQISSDVVDRRADIFSAGVVLWEALTGQRLFAGATDARVIAKILAVDVMPPSQLVAGLPAVFDEICMRALAREPDKRYATAREMALAIERASPLANASDISVWVDSLAHDSIEARAARVHEIESRSNVFARVDGDASSSSGFDALAVSQRRPSQTRTAATVIFAIVVVIGAVAVGFVIASHNKTTPTATSVASPPPATTTQAAPPIQTIAPAATATTIAQTTAAASATSAPQATTHKTRPQASAAPNAPTGGCAQPFTIDANGIKHVRPECL